MTRSFHVGLGLLSIAIVNAGCIAACTETSVNQQPAAAPAPTAQAATAQAPPAEEAAPVASASSVVPDTPAGAQFSRWLEAFNSGDREALLAYHEQHFPYSAASADVASIDREHGLSLGTQGFTVKEVEQSTPTALTLLMRERARPQFARVRLEVAPSAPHGVVHFEIGPIPTPPQFLSQDDLAARRVDAARRQAVIGALRRELEAHYVFADVARKMSEKLGRKAASGGYDTVTDAEQLAQILTEDLQGVSGDKHLRVRFGRMPPPPPPPGVSSDAPPPWIVAQNFGFGPIERLPGNVALLTINGFVPLLGPAVEEGVGVRMTDVADADAVIIDLRGNHGGSPQTVAFVASYFFEGKPLLLSSIARRDTGLVQEFWTLPELPGTRFGAAKPVYVLTSGRTFSGGEDLAYTLQAHRRATVIGETTAGGAHPTEPRAIDDSLFVMVPWGRSINPITKGNWEGTGVKPDVVAPAGEALERTLRAVEERKRQRVK